MNLGSRLSRLEKQFKPIELIDIDIKTLTDEELISYRKYLEGQCSNSYDRNKYKHLSDQELEELIKQTRDEIKLHCPNVKVLETLPDYIKKGAI